MSRYEKRKHERVKSTSDKIPMIFRINEKGDFDSAALLEYILSKPRTRETATGNR